MQEQVQEKSGLDKLLELRDKFAHEHLLAEQSRIIKPETQKAPSLIDVANYHVPYSSQGVAEGVPAELRPDQNIDNVVDLYHQKANQYNYDAEMASRDPRGPLEQYFDQILDDKPFYEGQEDPSGFGTDIVLAPIRGMKYAVDKGIEGYQEGKPFQVAGATGLGALMALPMAGPRAVQSIKSFKDIIPQTAKDVTNIVGQGAILGSSLATIDGDVDRAIAGTSKETDQQVQMMVKRRESLQRELDGVQQQIVPTKKTGLSSDQIKLMQKEMGLKGSDVDGVWGAGTSAAAELHNERINLKIESLNKRLETLSDQAIADFIRQEAERDKEAEESDKDKYNSKTTRENHPFLAPIAGATGLTGAGLLGYLMGRRNVGRYNKETADISKRWKENLNKSADPSDMVQMDQAARTSQHFGKMMDDALARNSSSGHMPHLANGALADIGMAAPELIDTMRGKVDEVDLTSTLGRLLLGVGSGYGLSKVGNQAAMNNKAPVTRYDAESSGLTDIVGHRGGPVSYYKSLNQKLGDTSTRPESAFRTRRQKLDNDAQRDELLRLKHSADVRDARLQSDGNILQREGLSGLLKSLAVGSKSKKASSHQPQRTQRQYNQDDQTSNTSNDRLIESNTTQNIRQSYYKPHPVKERLKIEAALKNGESVNKLSEKTGTPKRTVQEWKRLLRDKGELDKIEKSKKSPKKSGPKKKK